MNVDPGVEHDDGGDDSGDAERHREREERHPGGGKDEAPEYDGQAPGAAAGGAIRRRAGPGHQQQQQDVVDRHHEADEGAMIAERLPHQQRDEVAEQGPGDAREQPAETDDRAGEIRRGLLAGRVGNSVNHRPQ